MSDKPPAEPPSSEVTPEALYLRRREFLKNTGLFAGTAAVVAGGLYLLGRKQTRPMDAFVPDAGLLDVPVAKGPGPYDTDEPQTPYEDVTTYNNFYEFGTRQERPGPQRALAPPRPWTVSVEGEVAQAAGRSTSTRCSAGSRWRSASTACAASRPGRW